MSISQLFYGRKSVSKDVRRRRGHLSSSRRPPARGLRFEPLECRALLSTLTVVNTNDTGLGSLRWAIEEANASAGADTIEFNISTGDPNFVDVDSALPGGDATPDAFVIKPLSILPALSDASGGTTIDARTQTAFTGDTNPFGPEIVLDGSAITVGVNGLHLSSDNNQVHGLNIQQFGQSGVQIEGDGNIVTGCYIGTDATGTLPLRNHDGIEVRNASHTMIGGTAPGAGNVIAGNALHVWITGSDASNNTVQGNRIGTDASGTVAVTNGWLTGTNDDGVVIEAGAHHNLIGGSEPGAGNVISGHWEQAIWIRGASPSNRIEGNRLGTNAAGTALLAEDSLRQGNIRGVLIQDSPDIEIIDNVASGNYTGIEITGATSTGHVIQGNRIGTDITGTIPLGNVGYGINISGSPGVLIGGTTEAQRNIISANGRSGIHVGGETAEGTVIQGNYIGNDVTGTQDLGNGYGVRIVGAPRTLVGGSGTGAGNLISGNNIAVAIGGAAATGNRVQNNIIGADMTGLAALGNAGGVVLTAGAHHNFIGTDGDGIADDREGNLISGNSAYGVLFWQAGTENNVLAGNLIGTDATGLAAMPNAAGVYIFNGAARNLVGTNADGVSDDLERNIVSGNVNGISIVADPWTPTGADGNTIAGNYIGTDITGAAALGNTSNGIHISWSRGAVGASDPHAPTGNIIGGTNPAQRNIISANGDNGIYAHPAVETVIQGNFIGTDVTGTVALGNGGVGVVIENSSQNVVGGTTSDARNIISANGNHGVAISGRNGTGNLVEGNYIGVDVTGTQPLGNSVSGIVIADSSGHTIRGNVSSDNGDSGVYLVGVTTSNNVVEGNFLGTDATGAFDLGNTLMGVFLLRATTTTLRDNLISGNDNAGISISAVSTDNLIESNLIGTDATGSAALGNLFGISGLGSSNRIAGNVISGNTNDGVRIDALNILDGRGSGNVVQGNLVGVGLDGETAVGNGRDGVRIWRGAHENVIGFDADGIDNPSEANVIAHNGGQGVNVFDDASVGNMIRGNSIHSNVGLGIDLGGDGVTPNDAGDPDIGPNNLQNFPVISRVESGATTRVVGSFNGAPSTTLTLDFYANSAADPSGFGEGQRWLGSAQVTTDTAGDADFNVLLAATTVSGEVITATATAPDGSTSEFSGDDVVARPPVQIDIKPGGDPNSVNLIEQGLIAVAILTTDSFDASQVDATSVVFAGAHAVHSALEDTDGDGDLDLILHFEIQETNLADVYAQLLADDIDENDILDSNHQTATISLTGETATDEYFEAFDDLDLFLSGKNLRDFLDDLVIAGVI